MVLFCAVTRILDRLPLEGFLVAAFTATIAAISWLAMSGIKLGRDEHFASEGDRSSGVLLSMFVTAAGTFLATLVMWYGTTWAMGMRKAWGKARRQRRRAEMIERRRSEK